MRPVETRILGRARLEQMRRVPMRPGNVERELRAFVRESRQTISAVVLRCRTDHGAWGTDPHLDQADGRELVDRLMAMQLPVYRELLERGVMLFLHVEAAPHDVRLFRDALQTTARSSTPVIRQRVIFVTSSFESALPTVAQLLPGIETRHAMRKTHPDLASAAAAVRAKLRGEARPETDADATADPASDDGEDRDAPETRSRANWTRATPVTRP